MGLISRVSSRTYRFKMSDNKAIVRPIIYGNSSLYFKSARATDKHTHQWTVYLRPYYKNDPILSKHMVKKVVFKLHDSFPNNTRTFTEGPPYEVTETGWGEFDVTIKIYWNVEGKQTDRNPLTMYHPLKLFCADTPENVEFTSGMRPHVCEHYDEIIFNQPVAAVSRLIQKLPPIPDRLAEYTPKLLPYTESVREKQKAKQAEIDQENGLKNEIIIKKEVIDSELKTDDKTSGKSTDSDKKSSKNPDDRESDTKTTEQSVEKPTEKPAEKLAEKPTKNTKPEKSSNKSNKTRNKDKHQMKPPQKIPEPVIESKTEPAATRRKRSCTQQAKSLDKEDASSNNVLVGKDELSTESKTATPLLNQKTKKLKRESTVTVVVPEVPKSEVVQPYEIPLNSDVLLLDPQELLAHNYPVLEEETLNRLTEARKRIREHIAQLSDELRIKRDMLDALHETL